MIRPPRTSTLFPYTTLFRSNVGAVSPAVAVGAARTPELLVVGAAVAAAPAAPKRSEEHTSELQSLRHLVCRLLLEKKKMMTSDEGATWTEPAGRFGRRPRKL